MFFKKNKKNIKILMITGQYPPDLNGAAIQCSRIIQSLSNLIDFEVITSPCSDKNILSTNNVKRILIFNNFFSSIFSLIRIGLNVIANRFSIIHIHGYSKKTLPICILGKISGSLIVLKLTSFGVDDLRSINNGGFLNKLCLLFIDSFICPSPAFINDLINSKYLNYYSKTKLISNGVDLSIFRPILKDSKEEIRRKYFIDINSFVIIWVGHFSSDKGLDDIIKSLSLFSTTQANITILLVGSRNLDHYEVDLDVVNKINRFKQYNKNIKVKFIEKTFEIEKYYQCSDLFILTSRREGMPNALLEAMACNIAVIATRLNGITDNIIKSNCNGILYDAGDFISLNKAIYKLWLDNSFREKIALNGLESIKKNYDIKLTALILYNHYHGLLEEPRKK